MIITLDTYELPKYATLVEATKPEVGQNVTLNGSLFVDYRYNRRAWVISWSMLEAVDYNLIKAKYDKQFTNDTLLRFIVSDLGIDTYVYMSINDKNIRYNGTWVDGITITLEEADAVS